MKAKYVGKCFNRNGTKTLFYSYREHEYAVTDYGWTDYHETLAQQHHEEQAKIDALIEDEKNESTTTNEIVENSPADVAIAELWEYWEKN